MDVAALAGGVGGAKLLVGLQRELGSNLTAIVNTADDAVFYGVHVSPDVDIVTYWLAGLADTSRGWGLRDDRFTVMDALRELGTDAWFNLGDRDLATCIYRTQRLREGADLTTVVDEIRERLGVRARVMPMSNDEVRTFVRTDDGRVLGFQEYFVKERHAPDVSEVWFEGIGDAKPGPGLLDAIGAAELVVLCPSNPVVSIAPILGLREVREALVAHPRVVAVSPIVQRVALKGPADRLLRLLGVEASATGVARSYEDLCDVFVLDELDRDEAREIEKLGMQTLVVDTIMSDHDASARLAKALLSLAEKS